MAAEVVGERSGHPALAGLARVREGLDLLLGASTWSLSDAEVRAAVVDLTAEVARVDAARGVLLREAVSREVPDARGRQGARTVNLLKSTCRASGVRAAADVANAMVTCPDTGDLRAMGAALAAGEISSEHLDVARRCLRQLPKRLVRERRDEVDQVLTEHAKVWDPGSADLLARHLVLVVAPDRGDRYDEQAIERRHLGVSTDSTGMVLVRGQLDPAAGLAFVTTLDHLVAQDRAAGAAVAGAGAAAAEGGEGGAPVPDLRTRGQRRADALGRAVAVAAEQLGLEPPLGTASQQLGLSGPAPTAHGAGPTGPARTTAPGGDVAPDHVAPDHVAPDHVAPDHVAADQVAADQVAADEEDAADDGDAIDHADAADDGDAIDHADAADHADADAAEPAARRRAARAVPRVVVVTTADQLAGEPGAGAAVTTDGSLLARGTLARLSCDAVIDRVVLGRDGRLLAMDTLGRLATVAQQHALAARDGGCTWPGCAAPPSLCEAHHVVWWSRGGPTTIDNLALLCHRHHTQVHAEPDDGWQMVMREGLPWFRPPVRLDPARTLRCNTFHQAVRAARRTGTRWRTSPPETDAGPAPP